MQVIEGDKTPLSYLQAAIVYHELNEFGAIWHGTTGEEMLFCQWKRNHMSMTLIMDGK
ncbi:hypothetical protein [Peribacillus butanolivorans]|uniref:hypothetical protein n=1 Tax=Peribacillus butanolivorans TaxID=421767 RepID=UPI001596FFCB|nr:hypothetical protein [Peribacillus butanolivorans]